MSKDSASGNAAWGFCPECRRWVCTTEHECDGDPRSTCMCFGCGRPIVERQLVETHGDGRVANLGLCTLHAAKVCPKCAGTGLDGPRDQWGFGMPCPRCNGTGKR